MPRNNAPTVIPRSASDDIRYLVIYYLVELGSQEQQSLRELRLLPPKGYAMTFERRLASPGRPPSAEKPFYKKIFLKSSVRALYIMGFHLGKSAFQRGNP